MINLRMIGSSTSASAVNGFNIMNRTVVFSSSHIRDNLYLYLLSCDIIIKDIRYTIN